MTAQVHEKLVLNGEATSMACCPPLPENDSRIIMVAEGAAQSDRIVESTACYRRYIGTWEIKDDKFYLSGLKGRYGLSGDGPIFAEWFTGTLRIPRGRVLRYSHAGFSTVHEHELEIDIARGVVTGSRTVDNRV